MHGKPSEARKKKLFFLKFWEIYATYRPTRPTTTYNKLQRPTDDIFLIH
jgi:hypothetical protein